MTSSGSDSVAVDSEGTDVRWVDGSRARELIAAGALLLDVTPASRAERSFIEGRIHVPLNELEARMSELPRDQTIVVYCLGGGASPRAGDQLQAAGYDVYVLGARANWDPPD